MMIFLVLYKNIRREMIDSIIEDTRVALVWSKEFNKTKDSDSIKISESDISPIYKLNKILEQESQNLRPTANELFTNSEDKSVLFAQQMLIRSLDLNYTTIVDKSRRFLSVSEKPFLDLQWAKVPNKEALIMTLEGHLKAVRSVAITSDNTKVVSGFYDNTIKVWDIDTGRLLNTLEGHTSTVRSVAISSDNSKIVSGSYDNTIKVWDIDTGRLLNTLEGHSYSVNSVAISSDNSKIVSGSGSPFRRADPTDNTIKVWDLNTGRLLNTLEGHSYSVNSVAISSDNSKIVSGSDDNTIKVWDIDTGRLLNTLESHSSGVRSVVITSDNTKIVSGGDKTIEVWNRDNGKCYLRCKFDERM
jgi:WD40 repeat protein